MNSTPRAELHYFCDGFHCFLNVILYILLLEDLFVTSAANVVDCSRLCQYN